MFSRVWGLIFVSAGSFRAFEQVLSILMLGNNLHRLTHHVEKSLTSNLDGGKQILAGAKNHGNEGNYLVFFC